MEKVGYLAVGMQNPLKYPNLFVSMLGKTEDQVAEKLEAMKQHFFFGNESSQRIYKEVNVNGTTMAYIRNVGYASNSDHPYEDVRSEGMSYAMMICAQLDMKTQFDRLWAWAKHYMRHDSGARKGYFAWHCKTDGTKLDQNPAPDGEEYFVTSLYFAWKRWGDDTYKKEADELLDVMLNKPVTTISKDEVIYPMFNTSSDKLMICFSPVKDKKGLNASGGKYYAYQVTNPSYHLPAFYELWAVWADKDNDHWRSAAYASRCLFCYADRYLALYPDMCDYDGNAVSWKFETDDGSVMDHENFQYDAWRVAMNISLDLYWWWEKYEYSRLISAVSMVRGFQDFFASGNNGHRYTMEGKAPSYGEGTACEGLDAMKAFAVSGYYSYEVSDAHLENFWNKSFPSGTWRYYDGCLYMLAMLQLSGNYRIQNGEDW